MSKDLRGIAKVVFALLSLALLSLGCGRSTYECLEPTPNVPEPELVSFTKIPRPFSESTYFLYRWPFEGDAVPILEMLLDSQIDLKAAWYPDWETPGPCMNPLPPTDQLIVMLDAPDIRIYDLGFVSDSTRAEVTACYPIWEYYRFSN